MKVRGSERERERERERSIFFPRKGYNEREGVKERVDQEFLFGIQLFINIFSYAICASA